MTLMVSDLQSDSDLDSIRSPWDRFRFLVMAFFVKKKQTWLTRQKVFPLPTVGAPSASNSPSALSARARWARALRARAG